MRAVAILAAVMLAGCAHQEATLSTPRPAPAALDVKTAIVAASIYGYETNAVGRCPCPYSKDINGGTCGGKSAWSIKGRGAEPRCYRSPEDVKRWREIVKAVPERPYFR